MSTEQSYRFRRGWERLMEVDAEGGERVIENLRDVAPDLGRYVVEFACVRCAAYRWPWDGWPSDQSPIRSPTPGCGRC
jgi:hypothetical protein